MRWLQHIHHAGKPIYDYHFFGYLPVQSPQYAIVIMKESVQFILTLYTFIYMQYLYNTQGANMFLGPFQKFRRQKRQLKVKKPLSRISPTTTRSTVSGTRHGRIKYTYNQLDWSNNQAIETAVTMQTTRSNSQVSWQYGN